MDVPGVEVQSVRKPTRTSLRATIGARQSHVIQQIASPPKSGFAMTVCGQTRDCHIPLRCIRNDGMRCSKRHCESDEGGRGNLFAHRCSKPSPFGGIRRGLLQIATFRPKADSQRRYAIIEAKQRWAEQGRSLEGHCDNFPDRNKM